MLGFCPRHDIIRYKIGITQIEISYGGDAIKVDRIFYFLSVKVIKLIKLK